MTTMMARVWFTETWSNGVSHEDFAWFFEEELTESLKKLRASDKRANISLVVTAIEYFPVEH